jgi:hypothetical protein
MSLAVLADADAADRAADELVRATASTDCAPQVLEHAALHDAEQRLAARVAAELAVARARSARASGACARTRLRLRRGLRGSLGQWSNAICTSAPSARLISTRARA